ncbi:MAG: KEOPS complex subunit Cgi121 [Candidatus Bathyarchaeia archaeon]|nr:KEOPS complex subunit Cgi121 [Candidatus Bathyarchaeia archaeon]
MLKHIEEAGKYVELTGFRNINISNPEEFVKAAREKTAQTTWVQFFDAELVATWQHLYFAVLNALLAFRNRQNISKSVAMEVMLYVSAQRQIRKAIQLMGVKRTSASVAVVIIGEKPASVQATLCAVSKQVSAEPDETVLELTKEKTSNIRKAFIISSNELEAVIEKENANQALVNMIIERTALLSTQF